MGLASLAKKAGKAVKSAVTSPVDTVVGGVKSVGSTINSQLLGGDREKALDDGVKTEKQLIEDANEANESDLLKNQGDYSTDFNPFVTDVQANGMPKGQQEAMKYQMEQAQKGVASSYAGGGKGRSGSALKALSDRQQGIASQNYQQAYENNLNANNQNFNQALSANGQNFDQAATASQQSIDNRNNYLNASLQNNTNNTNNKSSKKSTTEKVLSAFNPFG